MRESRICWFVVLLAKKEDFLKAPDNGGPKATKGVVVSASMLSADFANLSASVGAVEAAGADWLHVDVMDGCFVPSITVGPVVIAGIKKCTRLVLDVHLMVKAPASHLRSVIDAGADIITVHAESDVHLYRFVREVKSHGKKVGVSLVPKTHHSALEYVIHELDLVLVMSVDPGFGGQEFLTSQLRKIEKIRTMVEKYSLQTKISVDGGVTTENVGSIVNADLEVILEDCEVGLNAVATIFAAVGRYFIGLVVPVGRMSIFCVKSVALGILPPYYFLITARQFFEMWFFSLPIVGMTALFTGGALVLQDTLVGGGKVAAHFMAGIVTVAIVRELGPVLIGLIVAGRVGAAVAAEIGTMRITEQIDALDTLEANPFQYLVAPRVIALMIAMPVLIIYTDFLGIFGGYAVGTLGWVMIQMSI
ncbi:hypothetical protein GH714_043009 [Hevea brasiliensis]|uniref:ribulose-phosphate 3-epimerase n=1 Tax=Hevea brasiliensis TaxID=3981 RepID=A0A6A6K155_HEVBR|nr:hypothetical protein GH714_043009 [Hevea brasiliensis]